MLDYTIYFGADHRGFEKKAELIKLVQGCHDFLKVEDIWPAEYNPDDDFNDAALQVAEKVLADERGFGVLLCGSAHGVCMQANRIKGIRAIYARTPESAAIGREHDYANVLCLSADEMDPATMEPIVKAFCHARPNPDERYRRRVERLDQEG